MPRTLDATLEAALDSGSFTPYFLVTARVVGGAIKTTGIPVKFKLEGINLSAKWNSDGTLFDGYSEPSELEFMITRGVTIEGINYTISSSYYY